MPALVGIRMLGSKGDDAARFQHSLIYILEIGKSLTPRRRFQFCLRKHLFAELVVPYPSAVDQHRGVAFNQALEGRMAK